MQCAREDGDLERGKLGNGAGWAGPALPLMEFPAQGRALLGEDTGGVAESRGRGGLLLMRALAASLTLVQSKEEGSGWTQLE